MGYDDLQVIKLCDALEAVTHVLKEERISHREEAMLESLVLACPQIFDGGEPYILKDDLNNFCKNFIKSLREGDANFIHKEKGYKGRLVDIEEFVESKEYLNQKGAIRPVVKYELERIDQNMDNIREVVLTGCVTGDTLITIFYYLGDQLCSKLISFKDLYYNFKAIVESSYLDIYATSLKEDNTLGLNKIKAIYLNGIKPVYMVVTETGKFIKCTKEHCFKVPGALSDYKPLGDLKVGDIIISGTHDGTTEEIITLIYYLGEEEVFDAGMHDPYNNYVLASDIITHNSTAWGKSYLSRVLMCRILYKLSMLHNPQYQYDLAPGSSITMILQSQSLRLSKKILFNPLLAMMASSPYFVKNFPFNKQVTSELQFPNHIYVSPVSGSEMAALGLDVYAGVMSEVNYFDVVENSQMLTMRGHENTTYDQAINAYTNLIQRLKNRFQDHGKIPGCLVLDSAVHYPGDFLDRKIQEAKWDSQIHVVHHAIWDTLSKDRFSGKKFLVEIGNMDRNSRIIEAKEFALPDADLLEVPEEYRTDFERDIEMALRDFAGIATGHRRAFMPFKEAVADAHTVYESVFNGEKLFTEESIDITNYFDGPFEWEKLINKEYFKQISFNSKAEYCMHVDLGISKDKVGLSIGHVHDYKSMPSTSFFSNETNSFVEMSDMDAPVICIDGMLQIVPPPGGEVSVDTLRGFMLYLCRTLNIKIATMDNFEHVSFVQALRKIKGLRSGVVSTVSSHVPYMELKAAYVEGRIIHQNFEKYTEELLYLEYDPKKKKIDHIPSKSKDLTDSVASVVHMLTHKIAHYKRNYSGNKTEKTPQHRQIMIAKI